jgi:probable rRNA maturation factor
MTNSHRSLRPNLKRLESSLYRLSPLCRSCKDRIDVILTDDACIKDLAGEFRGSPRATDVLAFYYGEDKFTQGIAPIGEIVVSLDTAKKQAAERKVSFHQEVLLLILHGLLHIGGQGDENVRDWCEMRKSEFELLMRAL